MRGHGLVSASQRGALGESLLEERVPASLQFVMLQLGVGSGEETLSPGCVSAQTAPAPASLGCGQAPGLTTGTPALHWHHRSQAETKSLSL